MHQDAEIVEPGLLRQGARGARATRTSASSAASARSGCAASPGGRARSPGRRSPTATASSAAAICRRSRGTRTSCPPYARTGEVDTVDGFVLVLSPWVGAQRPLRRVARPAARLRLRLLPAGSRRGPQGRDRRLQRRPPPLARARQRPRDVDRGAHAGRREVGRPHAGRRHATGTTGGSARGAPRRRPRWRAPQAVAASSSADARDDASSSGELAEVTESTSWRLTAPLRRLNAARRARRAAMIALRLPRSPTPEVYERFAEPGIDARRRAGRRGASPTAPTGSIFRAYNLILDAAAAARRPRGARARPPGHRARRPRLLRQGARGARATRTSASPAASARSASAASRGGRARSPGRRSSTATASSAAASSRLRVDAGGAPAVRAHRRGRRGRRLPARALAVGGPQRSASTSRSASSTATTSTSACRCAPPAARW